MPCGTDLAACWSPAALQPYRPCPPHRASLSKERQQRGDAPDILVRGDDWAEKISFEVARLMGVPAATTELALSVQLSDNQSVRGSISRDGRPSGWVLSAGASRLEEFDDAFDADTGRGHTLEAIEQALAGLGGPPKPRTSRGRRSTCSPAISRWTPGSSTPTDTRITGRWFRHRAASCAWRTVSITAARWAAATAKQSTRGRSRKESTCGASVAKRLGSRLGSGDAGRAGPAGAAGGKLTGARPLDSANIAGQWPCVRRCCESDTGFVRGDP